MRVLKGSAAVLATRDMNSRRRNLMISSTSRKASAELCLFVEQHIAQSYFGSSQFHCVPRSEIPMLARRKFERLPPLKVEKGADGVTALKTVGEVLSNHSDVYAAQCKL
jgi:hypothetical protein